MLYMAPWYWLFVPVEIISGSLRGMGDTIVPTFITAVGICLVRVVWIFTVVPLWHDMLAVTVSYPLTWGLTAVAFIVYFLCFRRKRLVEEPEI